MEKDKLIAKIKKFPETPGVYVMRDKLRRILYVGKSASLKHRVLSYFQRPQETRIEKMLAQVASIEITKTDSAIEALFLENDLIKKHQPKYNVKLKDNKTFLGIFITKEDWPKIIPARLTQKLPEGEFYGPFPSAGQVQEALQIIRRIFPFRVSCAPLCGKACLEYHLGMCPGVCAGKITQEEYDRTIKQIKLLLRGKKKDIIADLRKQMREAAKIQEFEKAAKLRDRLLALQHIQDVALIREEEFTNNIEIPRRVEAYDISNIAGAFAVGSMVVLTDGLVDKSQYRKFKIKTVNGSDDIASIKEIFRRRFNHQEWPQPNLILIDGGKPQVNAVKEILSELKLAIPVVGIAKGLQRSKNEIIAEAEVKIEPKLLLKLRDEAHRFAIQYYRLRHRKSLK